MKARRRGFSAHESTAPGSTEWYTPPDAYDALGLDFDLDPCSPGKHVVPWSPAHKHLTKVEDGLTSAWKGSAFVNPPYLIRTNLKWMVRFVEHGYGIALMSSRTDNAWFHYVADAAHATLFTKGRIKFITPGWKTKDVGGAGSIFFAMGERHVHALVRYHSIRGGWLKKGNQK